MCLCTVCKYSTILYCTIAMQRKRSDYDVRYSTVSYNTIPVQRQLCAAAVDTLQARDPRRAKIIGYGVLC